jgi:hypothetical protein
MKSLSNLLSCWLCTAVFMVSRAVQRGEKTGWVREKQKRLDAWESLHVIFIPRTLNPKASCQLIVCHASDFTMMHDSGWDKNELVIKTYIDIHYRRD